MSSLKVPDSELADNMNNLLETGNFSDMALQKNNIKIPVHKAILAARSPVFAAMFQHDLEENKQGFVSITDLDIDVLREMLRFIYTGKVTKLETMADSLLAAADKVSSQCIFSKFSFCRFFYFFIFAIEFVFRSVCAFLLIYVNC